MVGSSPALTENLHIAGILQLVVSPRLNKDLQDLIQCLAPERFLVFLKMLEHRISR